MAENTSNEKTGQRIPESLAANFVFQVKLFLCICQDHVERQQKAPGTSIKGHKEPFEVFINHKTSN